MTPPHQYFAGNHGRKKRKLCAEGRGRLLSSCFWTARWADKGGFQRLHILVDIRTNIDEPMLTGTNEEKALMRRYALHGYRALYLRMTFEWPIRALFMSGAYYFQLRLLHDASNLLRCSRRPQFLHLPDLLLLPCTSWLLTSPSSFLDQTAPY